MQTPQTFEEFKALIHGMRDRERFVFDLSNPNEEEGSEVEFYFTIRRDPDHEPQGNLYYQYRDSLGRHRKAEGDDLGMEKGNKRITKLGDGQLQTYYSWLKK
jgi:hypothetical protein